MERIKKYRCGIRIILLFIWTALAMTGCTRREEIFLEEASDEQMENSEESSKAETETEETGSTAAETLVQVTEIPQKIFVDVCGAVVSPGVYELDEGARVFQAVDAAGGYLPEAASDYLNRARSIADGQQIYVPTEEEVAENPEFALAKAPEALGNVEETAGTSIESGTDSRIDLNTADAEQLSTLSGIGQSKAEAIIAYREEHGNFASIEEIMNVEGIKEGTFAKIKDKISAG